MPPSFLIFDAPVLAKLPPVLLVLDPSATNCLVNSTSVAKAIPYFDNILAKFLTLRQGEEWGNVLGDLPALAHSALLSEDTTPPSLV